MLRWIIENFPEFLEGRRLGWDVGKRLGGICNSAREELRLIICFTFLAQIRCGIKFRVKNGAQFARHSFL
jgi:hypothetical protein